MMINRIVSLIIILMAVVGCRQSKLFHETEINSVLVCDTIYNDNLRNGYLTLSIFQRAPGIPVKFMNDTYYEYGLSTTNEFSFLMFSSRNEIIYLTSKDALIKSNYRLEKFIDLNAKPGDAWDLNQGGILGNSQYKLDSIDSSNDLFYLSLQSIVEVDDAIVPYKMILSRRKGIIQVGLNVQGDSTICKCNHP